MKKRTVFLIWVTIIGFIMILIPYVQNVGGGPSASSGISLFMGYYKMNSFGGAYLYIITMGMIEGVLITLLIQSLLKDYQEPGPTKFELNQ